MPFDYNIVTDLHLYRCRDAAVRRVGARWGATTGCERKRQQNVRYLYRTSLALPNKWEVVILLWSTYLGHWMLQLKTNTCSRSEKWTPFFENAVVPNGGQSSTGMHNSLTSGWSHPSSPSVFARFIFALLRVGLPSILLAGERYVRHAKAWYKYCLGVGYTCQVFRICTSILVFRDGRS